jgi:hypothetical protein
MGLKKHIKWVCNSFLKMFVEWLYDGLLNMGLSMELEDDPMMMSA